MRRMNFIFRNGNFTKLFIGRLFANAGDSFYMVGAMWMVYNLGGSTFYTGLAGFLTSIPRIIQFLYGPFIDRWPLRRMLVTTQLTQALLLLIVPIGYACGFLSITLILILMPIISILNQFMYPAEMAALPKVLPREQLAMGNMLFTAANQGSDAAFNALGGLLIGAIGVSSLFLINSSLFFITAFVFSMLTVAAASTSIGTQTHAENEKIQIKQFMKQYGRELTDGIKVLMQPYIKRLLAGILIINFAGGALMSILPEFGNGPEQYGLLMASMAVGGILGTVLAPALRIEQKRLGLLFIAAFLICGLLWMLCSQVTSPWLAAVLFGIGWLPGGVTNVASAVFVQTLVPESYMGRVMAAISSFSGLAMPLGFLLGGALATYWGSSSIMLLCGMLVCLVSIFWLMDPMTRRMPSLQNMDADMLSRQITS
ncbi:MFS transporter [Paenibacillus sp. UMB4589-SE434]|uniref:MFS transporter n=1 Tax=Paenibacillus sp. UMB4589-SE434 TaxID=3046314 RepID=UPI002550B9E6|nr:MFS transporter [Paenibacillus sp. UMB4589-SE434]MDK8181056.1 MFS transporter [Paenibacillus sp. UMB4589-SE434]